MAPARRSMADVMAEQRRVAGEPVGPPVSVPVQASPAVRPEPPAAQLGVPEPYESTASGPLTSQEHQNLTVCETALNVLRVAFAQAGKALQTIRDARLYREEFSTFEDYCEVKWQMSRQQAYRLIQAWPVAEAVSPIGDTVNEGQVRELVPIATRHGRDAAVTVYRAVAEIEGVNVTAAILKRAVAALPPNHWDPELATRLIREHLTEDKPTPAPVDPATGLATELGRVMAAFRNTRFLDAYRAGPAEQRHAVVESLRALADELAAQDDLSSD